LESLSKSLSIDLRGEASLKGWRKERMTSMDELREEEEEEEEQSEAETKAEIIYWATGRTKIYPEKNFEMRYAKIKARSEQKRKDKTQK
jgi:hypothetical protein